MVDLVLKSKTLLVVDDEPDLREIVASELEYMGAKVFQAENVSAAKELLEQHHFDLIVSDIRMPGGTGVDLLNFVKAKNIDVPPIILITGFADITLENAFNQGAEALLSKPFKLEDLIQMAVKLTAKPEKRYSLPAKSTNKELNFFSDELLDYKIVAHECAIGRGGIALAVDSSTFKWDTGDVLNFNFKFKDVELLGTAICRWWKPQDQSSKAVLGLEFVQLSDSTFHYFRDYWNHHDILPYIPSLD
ncbi:MAG: response regulator [Bdellovibrionales bacterium]|nr:response regulator [Bdellovibrionales bacterium]